MFSPHYLTIFRPVYYMGIYSYGASITQHDERATRLARLDGIERVGLLIGIALSPILLDNIGIYANFAISVLCSGGALAYMTFVVKEPITSKDQEFLVCAYFKAFGQIPRLRPR